MKQYFKNTIKTIAVWPLFLPIACLALLAGMILLTSCKPDRGKETPVARVTENPRDLVMKIPMAEPTGEKLLVLKDHIPSLHIDLHYARSKNVSRHRLYYETMPAMLDASTTRKLAVAQATLLKQGYSLKVWDAYRPPEAHLRLWQLSGQSGYVADPRWGWSKHCSGRAVDVTLVDVESGREVRMPSRFDDFSKKAASNYRGNSSTVAENLRALQAAMRKAGFRGIQMEWWHFENAVRFEDNLPPIYADDAGVTVPQ